MTKVAVLRGRLLGYGVLHRARRRRQRRHALGAARGGRATTINERRENTDYLPGIELPPTDRRRPTTPRRRCDGADVVVSPSRPRRCAPTSSELGAVHPVADAVLVSLMKGVELGTPEADERGDRRGHRRRRRADRAWSAAPTSRTRSPNASRPRRSSPAPTRTWRQRLQDLVHSPAFRPYTNVDVVGCELGGAYKNVVALAVGMAVGLGLRRQHHGLGDHPRARRDRPAGDGAGRRPADLHGAGRARRPGRHLLVAAVAQPDLRREARPGHDRRGDRRLDPSGGRGRQVVLVAARPGPQARRRRSRSPSTSTRSSPAG